MQCIIIIIEEAAAAAESEPYCSHIMILFESEKILSHFPPVEFAFAYGSGAIKQGSYDYNRPNGLLRLILIF